jgi:phosphodiesterase/alkaline phosphatase D-like protein
VLLLVLSAPAAHAQTPAGPASTGAATAVTFDTATATGTVDPAGSATTYHFAYGTSETYDMQTSETSAGDGDAPVPVQEQLTGLAPSTTYHYELIATSGGVSVDGGDQTFTTPPTPAPTASTNGASLVGTTTATVEGSVDPDGVPTQVTFQYGTTARYGRTTSAQAAGAGTAAQSIAQGLTGLAPGTTYHYRVVASSAGGTVVGGDATFTTAAVPAPGVATGTASAARTTATLTGTVNPRGYATSYHFDYGTSTGYGHSTASHSAGAGTAAVAESAALSGLTPGTTYHYRLVATNAGGTIVAHDATFVTGPNVAPSVYTGAATAVGTTRAGLEGTINAEAITTTYYFEYGTRSPSTRTAARGAGAGSAIVPASSTLSGLSPGTRYLYRLVAVNAGGTVNGATRAFTTAKVPLLLTLTGAANPATFGSTVTFTGTLSGTGAGTRTIALEARGYPYRGRYRKVGTAVSTGAGGTFTLVLAAPSVESEIRAVTVSGSPAVHSAPVLERVRVRVGLAVRRRRGTTRLSGLIAPGDARVRVLIERRFGGRWVPFARASAHRAAGRRLAYARAIRRPGLYRVQVVPRSRALLSAYTPAVTVR